jgi:hypothetical protein
VWAAREAGYSGDDRTLATTASKMVREPRVRAAIEARGIVIEDGPGGRVSARRAGASGLEATPGAELDGPLEPGEEGAVDGARPLSVWLEIMQDPSALPSARNQAAAFVYRAQQAAAQAEHDADPLGTLRATVQTLLREKRQREHRERDERRGKGRNDGRG